MSVPTVQWLATGLTDTVELVTPYRRGSTSITVANREGGNTFRHRDRHMCRRDGFFDRGLGHRHQFFVMCIECEHLFPAADQFSSPSHFCSMSVSNTTRKPMYEPRAMPPGNKELLPASFKSSTLRILSPFFPSGLTQRISSDPDD